MYFSQLTITCMNMNLLQVPVPGREAKFKNALKVCV